MHCCRSLARKTRRREEASRATAQRPLVSFRTRNAARLRARLGSRRHSFVLREQGLRGHFFVLRVPVAGGLPGRELCERTELRKICGRWIFRRLTTAAVGASGGGVRVGPDVPQLVHRPPLIGTSLQEAVSADIVSKSVQSPGPPQRNRDACVPPQLSSASGLGREKGNQTYPLPSKGWHVERGLRTILINQVGRSTAKVVKNAVK